MIPPTAMQMFAFQLSKINFGNFVLLFFMLIVVYITKGGLNNRAP